MMYLLDVNALLALGVVEHEFHQRTERWVKKSAAQDATFATCAITELGFLRILPQASVAAFTVAQGQKQLQLMKSSAAFQFRFLADDQDAQQLPSWVHGPKQLTDGHLVSLAKAHGATLATLDQGIPDAFVIPR
jgi:toxin-antitoxin system PIN domain toxin